jgi:hypothetical protein
MGVPGFDRDGSIQGKRAGVRGASHQTAKTTSAKPSYALAA